MLNNHLDNLAVLIPSHDKFSDTWPYFFKLFFKYWPEVSQTVYLLSNAERYADPRIVPILVGEEISWSHNIQIALQTIPEDYVLIILEDFPLTGPVDQNLLQELFQLMKAEQAGYLRLMANPPPDRPCLNHQNIGFIEKGSNYRTSLQVAIWKKSFLNEILVPGESPWQFELQGTKRSNGFDVAMMSIDKDSPQPIPYFPNAIVRGVWVKEAREYLEREGMIFDSTRALESDYQLWLRSNWFRKKISKYIVQPLKKNALLEKING